MADPDGPTRRRVCAGLATLCSVAVAGCRGDETGDSPDGSDDGTDEVVPPALRLDGVALTDAFPIELVEPDAEPYEGYDNGVRISNVHWHDDETAHWHFQPLAVPLGERRRVRTRFVDAELEELPLGEGEPYAQRVATTEDSPGDLLSIAVDGGHVTLTGESEGTGHLVFELVIDGEVRWTSPELEFEVA